MSYLNEFHKKIDQKDFMGLLQLWEEYCTCDEVDGVELKKILDLIFESDYSQQFGQYAESILPLWKAIDDQALADAVFERIIDVQSTNSPLLADLSFEFLKERFEKHDLFLEKIRLVGLRTKESFRRAIRNYKLLTHMEQGKFVFHTAGWGTGEIMDISLIREELSLEFENVLGTKQLSFENAFKTLEPLDSEHFFAKRFGNPDALELQAKKEPIYIIKKLLSDLGPKTASEIKDELLEVVIPKKDWSNWWQSTRNKIKKDTSIEAPSSIQEPFKLLNQELSHIQRLENDLEKTRNLNKKIVLLYNFMRDFSELLRQEEVKEKIKNYIDEWLANDIRDTQRFQLHVFAADTHEKDAFDQELKIFIENLDDINQALDEIEIAAVKKKVLIYLRRLRPDWAVAFAELFLQVDQTLLREYLLKELVANSPSLFQDTLQKTLQAPAEYAEILFWYFQKIMSDSSLPMSDLQGRAKVIEAYLISLQYAERYKKTLPLAKKMVQILTQKKFAITRKMIEGMDKDFLSEFLLLISKCHSFTQHDIKIMHSLVHVVCPEIKELENKEEDSYEAEILWTSQEGLKKLQAKLHHLSTVEMVDVAKEIEEARSHGDLRENSEYKFALERRARIQHEISDLSQKVHAARILTQEDVDPSRVSIGTKVTLRNPEGQKQYTIMGPWDADTEQNIISFQSKLAKQLCEKRIGDEVILDNNPFSIEKIEVVI